MPGIKGRGGPKPKPTAIMAARKSKMLYHRRHEPRTKPELPPCPDWVSPDGRKYWREIGSIVESMQIMTASDRSALGLLADALAKYVAAKQTVYGHGKQKGTGMLTYTKDGMPRRHPMVDVMNQAWQQTLTICREFGLTPSSRTGVRMHVLAGGKDVTDASDQKATLFRA